MRHRIRTIVFLVGLFFCNLFCTGAAAETLRQGDYVIYYTTFPSTIIPAEVAASHNIVRAPNQIVVNISAKLMDEPATVTVTGHVINLLEQRNLLTFIEVRERDAIYYLANHTALEHDLLRFQLIVIPPNEAPVEIEILRRYE